MSDLYGLLGEKLSHSFSPSIHNLILEKLGLRGIYNLFEVKRENLNSAVAGLGALEAKGVNVTIPYKVEIMKYLDVLSKEAKKIGAVNTISFKAGVLTGYNTDYSGFGASLKHSKVDIKDKLAVILGTGGASKAVVNYLIDNGIREVTYISRDPQRSAEAAGDFKVISYDELSKINAGDIIINCTPCGMYPHVNECPIERKILYKFSTALDLIYNPEKTVFLKWSEEMGLKAVNGLYMLVAQAAASEEIWQDSSIDVEIIEEVHKSIEEMIYLKKAGDVNE
jgi:shikimate dehydrogenase